MLEYFRSWYNLVQKFVRVWKKLIINVIVSAENYIRSRYKSVLFDIEKEKNGNILWQIEFFIVIYFDRI